MATGRRGRPRSRGQGLVEFALVIPIVLLGLMILVDFGRVVYAQNAISQNAAAAARMASVADFCQMPGPPPRPCTDIEKDAAIRNRARTFSPLVTVPDCAIDGGVADPYCSSHAAGGAFVKSGPDRIVVRITITVPLITPIISSIVGGSYTISATAEELIR